MNKLILILCLTVSMINMSSQKDEILTDIASDMAKKAVKTIENFCTIDNDCYNGFFTIKNYCCQEKLISQCCNVLDFVFTNGGLSDKRVDRALRNPRPINVILFILTIALMFTSFLVCFCLFCKHFCCCCLHRKGEVKYLNFQNPSQNSDSLPMLDA